MSEEITETIRGVLTGRKIVRHGGHGWDQSPENLIHNAMERTRFRVYRFGVVEVGGVFHARPMTQDESNEEIFHSTDLHHHTRVTVYQPIHPSVTIDDVEGAVYCRDDGTYWTDFSPEAPGHRYEAESYAQAKLISHFQPRINKQNELIHAASDITERTLRHNVLIALNRFVDDSLDEIEKQIRAFTLGHFQQNAPHADNHRALVVSSIRAVLAKWKETGKTDVSVKHNVKRIESFVNDLTTALTVAPKILTRAEDLEASKPKVARQIAAIRLVADGSPAGINLKNKFTARDALTYTALSSDENVATVSVNRAMLTVTPGSGAGSATITVRATAPDERYVTQTFNVTVVSQ